MDNSSVRNPVKSPGFTLLEVLVVMVVLAVLIGISIPSYNKLLERARKVACIGNMKALHGALSSAVVDIGEWPQIPLESDGSMPEWDQEEYYGFWVETVEKYGPSQETWICPSDTDTRLGLQGEDSVDFLGSYVPTSFGEGAQTPYKWNQPWLVERAGFHGRGHHICMPDGSVTESANPFGGR